MSSRRLMALDFGLAQIGMAVGEEVSGSAQSLGAVRARAGRPQWAQLDTAIRQWHPQLILVGLPLHMDGSSSDMSERAKKFAAALEDRYNIPCTMSDERLSTDTARASWDGKNKTQLQGLSAVVILNDWMERQRDIGGPEGQVL